MKARILIPLKQSNYNYLNTLLLALVGSKELVEQWWQSPNRAFEMQYPRDVDLDRVTIYLENASFR